MDSNQGIINLTQLELSNIYDISGDVIENLNPSALNEILGGNLKDLDTLFEKILYITNQVINNNSTQAPNFASLSNFENSFDETLKIQSYNYFKSTMLPNFNQNERNVEWGNLIQLYPWSAFLASRGSGKSFEACMALPIWRMWRYRKPGYFQRGTIDNKNSQETVIITNESRLGRRHLSKIVGEIESNDLLKPILLPDSKREGLGKDKIVAKNGASVDLRSFGSFIRGLHVGGVVVDDFEDKSCLYSQEQRDKFIEVFDAEIKSIVEPYGNLWIFGTPFHFLDIYGHLKQDPAFRVFEYPAIDINGKLLAVDRYNYKQLMNLKRSLGSIIFSREYLVTPISDASSIFPWDFLRTSLVGMENISLVDNIESFPIKMKHVVVGVDFAISGNVAADYTVFSCWGRGLDNKYYLIYLERGQGWSHNEQVSRIIRINHSFKPNTIICENNGFQRVLIELVKERGVKNIKEFTTTAFNKRDDMEGLPSISAMFERCEIKIPYKVGRSKDIADVMLGEFNNIGYDEQHGSIASVGGHDDCVMSSFFALYQLRQKTGLKIEMVG